MTMIPDFEAFAHAYQAGSAGVAVTTLVADLETPVSAYLKLARGRAGNMFLLESVEGGAQRGRYSMIGLDPDLVFRSTGDRAEINRRALIDPDAFTALSGEPLKALRALLEESRINLPPGLPPMSAGVFGYLGYDMVRRMERLAPAKPDPIGVPETLLIRPTVMVVFDAARDEMAIVTPVRPAPGVTAKAAHESALARLDAVVAALEAPLDHAAAAEADPMLKADEPVSNTTEAEYMAMVAKAKDYIAAGDAFQIVLSQRFTSRFDLPAFSLYRALRRVNPSPYLCFLDFGGFQIVVSSPEILVRVRDGKVVIRPIAGTRPRGKSPGEDEALAAELLADPKERAEHLMLLDLGRNDVGRVAKIGTVRVTDSFFIERYSHVMHIVSNVEGELRDDVDPVAALAAGFPAGTVSGAPKVRAMEIIDELEKDKRGIYAGCIGYFGAGGEMDTCIVLRASVVKDGLMHVQAGAGIVYEFVACRRAGRMRQQGPSALPRRRGSGALRGAGQAGAVGAAAAAGLSPRSPDALWRHGYARFNCHRRRRSLYVPIRRASEHAFADSDDLGCSGGRGGSRCGRGALCLAARLPVSCPRPRGCLRKRACRCCRRPGERRGRCAGDKSGLAGRPHRRPRPQPAGLRRRQRRADRRIRGRGPRRAERQGRTARRGQDACPSHGRQRRPVRHHSADARPWRPQPDSGDRGRTVGGRNVQRHCGRRSGANAQDRSPPLPRRRRTARRPPRPRRILFPRRRSP